MIGIDPGTAATGYGVVHASGSALSALDAGVIETASATPLERRLALIHERVAELLDEHLPDAMAVEAVYFGQNARSALAVGHARGAALLAAGQRNVGSAPPTRPNRSRERSAATAGRRRRRCSGWSRVCSDSAASPAPITQRMRSRSPSAISTARP